MKRRALIILLLSLLAAAPSWAQGYAELEAEQAQLDERLLDLQHEIFRARQQGDERTLKELTGQLEAVQKRRIEVLRQLGHPLRAR